MISPGSVVSMQQTGTEKHSVFRAAFTTTHGKFGKIAFWNVQLFARQWYWLQELTIQIQSNPKRQIFHFTTVPHQLVTVLFFIPQIKKMFWLVKIKNRKMSSSIQTSASSLISFFYLMTRVVTLTPHSSNVVLALHLPWTQLVLLCSICIFIW